VPALGAREVPLIGAALGSLGLLLFLRLTPESSYLTDLLPGIMLTSIGMGLVFVPITLIATSGVPADDAGLASGLFNTSQQIGGALGLALLTTLATNRTTDELVSFGLQPTASERAEAFVTGYHATWLASAILLAAGGLLLLTLLRRQDVAAVAEGEPAPAVA
jgi:sugar phosphate permease